MKTITSSLLALTLSAECGLLPLGIHVDIRCHYETEQWSCLLHTNQGDYQPGDAFLPLSDKPYAAGTPSTSGARHTQPASSSFAFTGVSPGQPLWVAVQGTPGTGEAWPGFDNDQPAGTFGSYIPADTRVSQSTARPWIRIQLVDYQPPHGKSSHFSMWNTSTGQPPTVWMSTFNTNVENSYYYAAGTHTHAAWGFTKTGIHRVTLRASGFLGPNATNPTEPGEAFTLIFAVGTVARWQAASFDADEIADSDISSMTADPDGDGLNNIIEYAFGLDPKHGQNTPVSPGLGMPSFSLTEENGTTYQTLTYPRRKAGSRLQPDVYIPQFSETLTEPWDTNDITTQVLTFPAEQNQLNTDWELVIAKKPVNQGAKAGFARVAVTLGDEN